MYTEIVFIKFWSFFFFSLPHWVACRILALQLKTEPRPAAVKVQSPNHWDFPLSLFLQMFFMPTVVSPLLLGLPLCICRYAWECTMDFWGSVYFFTFFSLTFPCFSHWIIFIDWSSCLPILSARTEICCEAPPVNSFFFFHDLFVDILHFMKHHCHTFLQFFRDGFF